MAVRLLTLRSASEAGSAAQRYALAHAAGPGTSCAYGWMMLDSEACFALARPARAESRLTPDFSPKLAARNAVRAWTVRLSVGTSLHVNLPRC